MIKKEKVIKINTDKCTGCRSCEIACSAFHATPKYSITNPGRARIHVFRNEIWDEYVPVYASEYTEARCNGRQVHTISGKEYSLCTFCGASCPSRDIFKEPDSGLPLKCDLCESDPPLEKPMCVQVCEPGCLTYEEQEVVEETAAVEGPAADKNQEMEIGLESLIKKHGLKKVKDTISKLSK
jgi:benzoyl-CoA reductase subunit BamC